METPIDTLQFYVRAVTGLLLFLNLALLVAIQSGRNWAKQLLVHLNPVEEAEVSRRSDRALGLLIMVVIAMNAASVYANYQLRKSADLIVGDAGNSEMVIGLNSLGH